MSNVSTATRAAEKFGGAAQTLRHIGAIFNAIEYAIATGKDQQQIDTLSLSEIGTRIAGEAAEETQMWADLAEGGEFTEPALVALPVPCTGLAAAREGLWQTLAIIESLEAQNDSGNVAGLIASCKSVCGRALEAADDAMTAIERGTSR
jgi:hypothetical protein